MEDFTATGSVPLNRRTSRKGEMEDTVKEELPVITKVSLIKAPEDFKRNSSPSNTSHTIIEPTKEEPEDLNSLRHNSQPIDRPHVLLLLLHQKDLEIKGLKNAARGHPPDRLACILQELVRTRQKGPLKKSQTEDILQKEIEKLNSELKAAQENHMKEMQMMQEKLMRSQLCVLHLQDEMKDISPKSENESDNESSMSLDEGARLACESFELWSESGNRLLAGKSDLRLRRIPKHTSFVDTFHKFGSSLFSDDDKYEKVISSTDSGEIHGPRHSIATQSSQESSKTKESQSDPTLWAAPTSQKSDFVSAVNATRTSESSSSLLSLMGKLQHGSSIDKSHCVEYWRTAQSNFSLGQPSAGKAPWMPVSFTKECKRDSTITSSLKIVSVHHQGKFIRILNNLLNKEIDLSGYIIQQWVEGYPVSIYRFPNGTILPAQHHITVWAAGANLAQKQPSDTFLDSQWFFRAGPECTTILCNCSGQTVSQYTAPHRFTAAAEAYSDNVDLSVDKFPLTDDKEETLEASWPSKEEVALPAKTLQKEMIDNSSRALKTRYIGTVSIDSTGSMDWNVHPKATKKRISDASSRSSILSLRTVSYPLLTKDSHSSSSEDEYFPSRTWKPPLEEPKAREFKTTLDTTLPMVALIGQKSARSKYGFKYMSYVPISTDLHLRRYYYGS
ncbi:lamin tail domain-containing protein 2 [Heteronotia binoei]|uniref:lamin tail domain-containing protein 2 n=1 Tax=Heteronotia binoei TaxID=13085 RepID=UPI00292DADA5|nr:lamin tail domain-containing protein 2 [Heteronotia binoei]